MSDNDLDCLDKPADAAKTFIERPKHPLSACMEIALARYFDDLDGHNGHDLYDMVMSEVEPPLLAAVLCHTRGNQSRAAEILGINRSTLRKKIEKYNLAEPAARKRRKKPR